MWALFDWQKRDTIYKRRAFILGLITGNNDEGSVVNNRFRESVQYIVNGSHYESCFFWNKRAPFWNKMTRTQSPINVNLVSWRRAIERKNGTSNGVWFYSRPVTFRPVEPKCSTLLCSDLHFALSSGMILHVLIHGGGHFVWLNIDNRCSGRAGVGVCPLQ